MVPRWVLWFMLPMALGAWLCAALVVSVLLWLVRASVLILLLSTALAWFVVWQVDPGASLCAWGFGTGC